MNLAAESIADDAWAWAKKNRTAFARYWMDPTVCVSEFYQAGVDRIDNHIPKNSLART